MRKVTSYLCSFLLPNLRTGVVLTGLFVVIICLGTLTPLPKMVDVSGTDKLHHFLAFAALTYPLTVASQRFWLPIIIFGLSFGASIEIIQPYLNRFGDIGDFTADSVGVIIGFLLGTLGYLLKLKIKNL